MPRLLAPKNEEELRPALFDEAQRCARRATRTPLLAAALEKHATPPEDEASAE